MIRAGVSIQPASGRSVEDVVDALVREALGDSGPSEPIPGFKDPAPRLSGPTAGFAHPDGAWLALCGDAVLEAPRWLALLRERLGPQCALVGGSADGLMAGGVEVSGEPGALLSVWQGADTQALLLEDLSGHEERAGAELASRIDGGVQPGDLLLLWPDADALLPGPLLAGLADPALAPATIAGVAAAPVQGAGRVWANDRIAPHALAALRIRPPEPPRIEMAVGCRPVTPLMEVTRARGTWLLGLAGRPALEVYREVARGPLAADLKRAARFLKVGIERVGVAGREDADRPGETPTVIRNVIGFDERKGAFSVAEPLRSGDRVVLALVDAAGAREDLKRTLQRAANPVPALGFYLGCRGRGEPLFGIPGMEAGYLASELGGAPIAGVHGAFQIGPGARGPGARGPASRGPELHTYAAVLALLDNTSTIA